MALTEETKKAMMKMMHEVSLALNGYNARTIEVKWVTDLERDEVIITIRAQKQRNYCLAGVKVHEERGPQCGCKP